MGRFKCLRKMYKAYLLTDLTLLTWMLPDWFNDVYFVYCFHSLTYLPLRVVRYYFFNIHTVNVLNGRVDEETKDIHVKKVKSAKNVSDGDCKMLLPKKQYMTLGPKL